MIIMKKILFCCGLAILMAACTKKVESGLAIVIDPQSYNEAKAEIDEYQQTVARRGLKPILVIDRWGVPDSIRAELYKLYTAKKNPIEGAVFIGDIPVAMVRDAQHFTTAFKMDQDNYPWNESSVPSDRFYDDFDLTFSFIKQDSARAEYFYYSLNADCAQKLQPEIYTARIFPRDNERGGKYEKLRRYMKRVNEADSKNNPLDKMFFFSGNGFISESLDARIDEKIEFYDDFPWMRAQAQSIEYVDHKRETWVKERVMSQMRVPETDYAVLHHHGSETIQYFSGGYESETPKEVIQDMLRYLRGQMREGKSKNMSSAEVQRRVNNYFGITIPASWYDGAFDEKVRAKEKALDEAEEMNMNLHVEEFSHYQPQARFVALDACYNGSYHWDESIQEGYLFTEGNGTLLVMANSVNVLQDKWVNRYVGLLGYGIRAGYMAKMGAYLEAHLFGDPTFSFTPAVELGFDVNNAILTQGDNFWKSQLNSEYAPMQILAMERLTASSVNHSDLILEQFKKSHSGIVRLQAMLSLASYKDDNFVEAVALALNDGHEMTQRFAVNLAGDNGDPRLVEPIVRLASKNNTSERIQFDLESSLRVFDSTQVLSTFDRIKPELTCYLHQDSVAGLIRYALHSYTTSIPEELTCIYDPESSVRRKITYTRMIRNANVHQMVPQILDYVVKTDADPSVQKVMWEALGWFDLSWRRAEIADAAKRVAESDAYTAEVRNEALKTYNRVR